jgi:hypothetical protein
VHLIGNISKVPTIEPAEGLVRFRNLEVA